MRGFERIEVMVLLNCTRTWRKARIEGQKMNTVNRIHGPRRVATLRKLSPTAKLPSGAILRVFSAEEIQLLRRRLTTPLECVLDATFSRANGERLYGPKRDPGSGLPKGATP